MIPAMPTGVAVGVADEAVVAGQGPLDAVEGDERLARPGPGGRPGPGPGRRSRS